MMFRTVLRQKTFAIYLLVPDKYVHITVDQLLLEMFVKPSKLDMWNSVTRFGTVLWNSLSTTIVIRGDWL